MRWLARTWYRLRGWKMVGQKPAIPKCVVLGAPHTSNGDFFAFLAVASHFDLPARYIGKHTLFRPPFGGLMRRLGGIPVRRDSKQGLVAQVTAAFEHARSMALVIAPEGTRGRADHWKSGFYRIATAAGVPIVCGFVDHSTKTLGLGPTIFPSGDIEADMNQIRAFYSGKTGKHPERTTPIRLADE
jgi:1-acyl-sn-glycerol-3-phosphate acyltransferase